LERNAKLGHTVNAGVARAICSQGILQKCSCVVAESTWHVESGFGLELRFDRGCIGGGLGSNYRVALRARGETLGGTALNGTILDKALDKPVSLSLA